MIHTVVGAQFGSEAKGHVAAQLAKRYHGTGTVLVRVGGSNAGHSAVDANGVTWALRQVPAAAVIDKTAQLVIARGSEVDPTVLLDEVWRLDAAGYEVSDRLYIDPYATVIESRHIAAESDSDLNARTGSTSKGIGQARADRLMRTARLVRDHDDLNWFAGDTVRKIREAHEVDGRHVIVEGTQGYGLGLHTPYYPQTTSGDCTTVDLMQQIGYLPLKPGSRDIHVWLVMRTYPIRVAGNSGPLHQEMTWDELTAATDGYIQPERTTVTKKIRRVGQWDGQLVRNAIAANGGNGSHMHCCLTFVDYLAPKIAGDTGYDFVRSYEPIAERIAFMEGDIGQRFAAFGTSPSTMAFDHVSLAFDLKARW